MARIDPVAAYLIKALALNVQGVIMTLVQEEDLKPDSLEMLAQLREAAVSAEEFAFLAGKGDDV